MPADDAASRYIPVDVRRQLRSEVGFGCPVQGCGNPYLTYHHFDPPWHVNRHNDPTGMIALCLEHHAKERAWTAEDFRAMKRSPSNRDRVDERYDWMRRDLLTVIRGNLYYRNDVEVMSRSRGPMLWYNRDEKGRLLLNFRMISQNPEKGTAKLDDNDWTISGEPRDIQSSPNGTYVRVEYPSGDMVSISFKERPSLAALQDDYYVPDYASRRLAFPLVTAEITMAEGGTNNVVFGPQPTPDGWSTTVGRLTLTGSLSAENQVGYLIG